MASKVTDILSADTAKVYVETLIASYGERYGNLRVTDVRQSPAAECESRLASLCACEAE